MNNTKKTRRRKSSRNFGVDSFKKVHISAKVDAKLLEPIEAALERVPELAVTTTEMVQVMVEDFSQRYPSPDLIANLLRERFRELPSTPSLFNTAA